MSDVHPAHFRPLFSQRYGKRLHGPGEILAYSRHGEVESHDSRCQDGQLQCACPGIRSRRCCQPMTQEDLLCDACRQWCVAIDSVGVYHRLRDLDNQQRITVSGPVSVRIVESCPPVPTQGALNA